MRDVIHIPLQGGDSLIIASDNSGAIGMKAADTVHVPYEQVAYYSFRVAVMECIAAGGEPFAVALHNFCGKKPWEALTMGINRGLKELNLQDVSITGSTESNFTMLQSAVGLLVLGKKDLAKTTDIPFSDHLQFAVIGMPLVGNEVIEREDQIAPLAVFQEVCKLSNIMIWPVGSKGIQFELNQMYPITVSNKVMTDIDVLKSSGPSTCFICAFPPVREKTVKQLTGCYYHPLLMGKLPI